jgi:hypothetical protein
LSLPLVDLQKGRRLGLPTGQAVAKELGLPDGETLGPADFPELTAAGAPPELAALAASTPLWYYCLKEAERFTNGAKLGPVGGRIVAEVLIGVLLADPASCLSDPRWRPESRFGAGAGGEFGMSELLAFAE